MLYKRWGELKVNQSFQFHNELYTSYMATNLHFVTFDVSSMQQEVTST